MVKRFVGLAAAALLAGLATLGGASSPSASGSTWEVRDTAAAGSTWELNSSGSTWE